MSSFKYAIFDMDGLLFDTETLYIESFMCEVSRQTGMTFDPEDLKKYLGLNKKSVQELFEKMYGTSPSCEECYRISNKWIEEYIEKNGVPVKPGVYAILEFLKRNGIKTALATGTDTDKAIGYARSTNILEYFDVIIGGDKITHSKPDPEIFLKAAEQMGCRDVKTCMVFEDSLNGLLAGHKAGMSVFVVPDQLDPTLKYPGYAYARIEKLDDAIAIISENE